MSELPENWTSCTLDNLLVLLESGSRPKGGVRGIESGVPSIGGEHLTYSGRLDFSSMKYVPEQFAASMTKGKIQINDILIVKDGATTGKTSFVDKDFPYHFAVVNEHVFLCRSSLLIEPGFLFRFLLSKDGQAEIANNFQGSAQGGINLSFAANTTVPLAPLNEQRRIVARLEKLLAKCEACKQRLDKIPGILKRFRQAILAAACSGRLTADWRKQNPGFVFQMDSSLESDIEGLDDLPETWCIRPIGNVIESLKYGTSKKASYEIEGVPVLRIPNIGDGVIESSDLKYAKLPEKEFEELKLIPGDILVIRSNGSVSLVGKSAIVRELEKDFAYAGYLIRLRPNQAYIKPNYLNLCISSYSTRLQIEIPARSTSGVNNINSEEVKNLKIPVPPLEEQKEIVQRVEKLFKLADEIEQRYQKAKAYVDKLPQAILAKAFRGELAPQDPNDEPASVLLERIRAEREAIEPQAAKGKQPRPRKKTKKQAAEQMELPGIE